MQSMRSFASGGRGLNLSRLLANPLQALKRWFSPPSPPPANGEREMWPHEVETERREYYVQRAARRADRAIEGADRTLRDVDYWSKFMDEEPQR